MFNEWEADSLGSDDRGLAESAHRPCHGYVHSRSRETKGQNPCLPQPPWREDPRLGTWGVGVELEFWPQGPLCDLCDLHRQDGMAEWLKCCAVESTTCKKEFVGLSVVCRVIVNPTLPIPDMAPGQAWAGHYGAANQERFPGSTLVKIPVSTAEPHRWRFEIVRECRPGCEFVEGEAINVNC